MQNCENKNYHSLSAQISVTIAKPQGNLQKNSL